MSIGVLARKLLWGRSRNECAYPGCSQQLTVDTKDPESDVLRNAGVILGEEAHIRSPRPDGPRHDPTFDDAKLDFYENLILLCPTHHTLVDKNGGAAFPVNELVSMKSNHEEFVHEGESAEAERVRIATERVAAAVQVWADIMGLEEWQGLTWGLNRPVPMISDARYSALLRTGEWLLAKAWPALFPRIRDSFDRLLDVVGTLLKHFQLVFEQRDNGAWVLRRRYKNIPWDPDLYAKLLAEFQCEAAMTWWLTAELSRAANLVLEAVRQEIDPLFRFEEGLLLARDGDGFLENTLRRVTYGAYDWENPPPAVTLDRLRRTIDKAATEQGVDPDGLNVYRLALEP